jgi:hypothetical protein
MDFDIDLHVKWFNWYMAFFEKLKKLVKPLDLNLKGFNWSVTIPKEFQNFLKT